MKNTVLIKTIRYSLLLFSMVTWFIFSARGESPYQQYNEQYIKSPENIFGQKQEITLWGEQEAFKGNETKSSRNYAPPLPDEPGSTCLPIPNGFTMLLMMALAYGLFEVFTKKIFKIKSRK